VVSGGFEPCEEGAGSGVVLAGDEIEAEVIESVRVGDGLHEGGDGGDDERWGGFRVFVGFCVEELSNGGESFADEFRADTCFAGEDFECGEAGDVGETHRAEFIGGLVGLIEVGGDVEDRAVDLFVDTGGYDGGGRGASAC